MERQSSSFIDWARSGIDPDAFGRYVDEQIYTLPGIDDHREVLSILLTGSRATGTYTDKSDVDIDVVCPRRVYRTLHRAAIEAKIIDTPESFFVLRPEKKWERYFGAGSGRPHFTVVCLEDVEDHIRNYRDVWLWVWTTARIVADPSRQFQQAMETFSGYPRDVLVRKIKYHWLLAGYWSIDVMPFSCHADDMIAAGTAAMVNTIHEFLKVFFLVEGKPFPYTEKLMRLSRTTELGREFQGLLQRAGDLIVGTAGDVEDSWSRLDEAFALLNPDSQTDNCHFPETCARIMIQAGVEPKWVEADYRNIDELLLGQLGPVPD